MNPAEVLCLTNMDQMGKCKSSYNIIRRAVMSSYYKGVPCSVMLSLHNMRLLSKEYLQTFSFQVSVTFLGRLHLLKMQSTRATVIVSNAVCYIMYMCVYIYQILPSRRSVGRKVVVKAKVGLGH